jgi:hypothetical protein
MQTLDSAIVITLGNVALKYKRPYAYPSQAHILRLLSQHHAIKISRRTLNRHLKVLELDRFFARIRRHKRGTDNQIIFRTTLYKLKKKFFQFAGMLKAQGARFALLFRVPHPAQYQFTPNKGSGCLPLVSAVPRGKALEEGGPPGTFSENQAQENLARVKALLQSLKFGS